jgi:hypothetical protein
MKRRTRTPDWDLFICHASEDKDAFVEPLANALGAFGVKVWYAPFALKVGDSLSRSIDKGLANSQFGLVVLSRRFFAKRWPEYELRGLTARELSGGKTILPVWHQVTVEEVVQFSPPLADKLAVQSGDGTPVQIALRIIEIVRPDIFTRGLRRIAHYQARARAKKARIDPTKIKPPPIRHKELPPDLISRIRLIRASLLGAYTHSMRVWKDGFQRDSHPSVEIAVWERIAAVYCEYSAMTTLSREQQTNLFRLVFSIEERDSKRELRSVLSKFPKDAYTVISRLMQCAEPCYDIRDELPHKEETDAAEPSYLDKESLPKDFPESLIRQVMHANKAADEGESEKS